MTRTLGPHGDPTEVSFPRCGSMGKVHLSTTIPRETTVVKDLPDSQMEPEDYGSGAQCRIEPTPHVHSDFLHKIENLQKHSVNIFLDTFLHRPLLLRADLRLNQFQKVHWSQCQPFLQISPLLRLWGEYTPKCVQGKPNKSQTTKKLQMLLRVER